MTPTTATAIYAAPSPTREEINAMLAEAPWPEAPSETEMDRMYADWCARNNVDIVAADGHKDHHYWVAA
jgi:hypothetical protein